MAGWDSGFHYYLLMFIPAIFVSLPLRRAVPAALVLWSFYVGLDVAMETLPVREPLARDALLVVRWFNVSVVFAMLAYLSRFYLQLANDAESRLRTLATTDPLTRLFNRRYILELATREAGEPGRARPAFLMADIDHFKNVNDDHGHDGGDIALAAVGEAIRRSVREPDSVARWGGEEFLVLLPGTGLDVAARIAERIRQEVQSLELDVRSRPLRLTLTLGVSTLRPDEGVTDAISRADTALYRGKELGRNRVVSETMLTG
jgi:diguanylate cyclase (GGDEF)-like protein